MRELRIKDICVKGSSTLKQKDVENGTGKYPVYGAGGIVGYRDSYDQEKEYIGIVKDGSGIGRVLFLPAKSSVIGTLQYILPKAGYDIYYIGYCLQSLGLSSYKQGAAIPHIYFRQYGERVVNVDTSAGSQREIVASLNLAFSKIDAMVENANLAVEASDSYFRAMLGELLSSCAGPDEKTLDSICLVGRGKSRQRPRNDPSLYGGPYPFIQTGDIRDAKGGIIHHYKQTYSEKGLAQSKLWPKGTICMTIAANIGETAILGFDSCFPDSVVGITPKSKDVLPEYINYYFCSIQPQIVALSRGFAQKNINLQLINKIKVLVPTKDEQEAIIFKLSEQSKKIEELKKNFTLISREAENLKQAMLRQIFI